MADTTNDDLPRDAFDMTDREWQARRDALGAGPAPNGLPARLRGIDHPEIAGDARKMSPEEFDRHCAEWGISR